MKHKGFLVFFYSFLVVISIITVPVLLQGEEYGKLAIFLFIALFLIVLSALLNFHILKGDKSADDRKSSSDEVGGKTAKFSGNFMFIHKKQVSTTRSIEEIKIILDEDDTFQSDFSENRIVLYEKLFWVRSFRPVVECYPSGNSSVELRLELRKIYKIVLAIYLALGFIVSLLAMVMGGAYELALVIMVWDALCLLLFWISFRHNCNRIINKVVFLLQQYSE